MKKMVKILWLSIIAFLLVFSGAVLSAKDGVTVFIDNAKIDFDVEPAVIDGRTMVPMRKIFEKLGADVSWNENTKAVTSVKGDKNVYIQIDASELIVNGEVKVLDVPAKLIDSRTMVPVRAISEAFDCIVKWDNTKREVHIYSNEGIVNVKDFGAVGDGVTDDKEAILNAFRYAVDNLPATVYFPEGEYGILEGGMYISLPNGSGGLTVLGDGGDKSVIKYLENWETNGSWVAVRIQPERKPENESEYLHDITFSDMGVYDTAPVNHAWTIEKNGTKEETHGFDIQYTVRATYRNCKINNVGDEALDLVYCKEAYIHDNIVINSPGAGSAGGAISVGDGCDGAIVENNVVDGTIEGKGNFGIAVESLVKGTAVKNVIIRNNEIKNIRGNAINIGAPGGDIINVLIDNNSVVGCNVGVRFSGKGTKENVTISNMKVVNVNAVVDTTSSQNNKNILINNFFCEEIKDTAIKIIGSSEVIVRDGTLKNCQNAVLFNTSKDLLFENVLMDGVGLSGTESKTGAIYQSNYTNSTVSGCIIKNCAFPVGISKMDKVYNTEIYINDGVIGTSIKSAKEIVGGIVNRRVAVNNSGAIVKGLTIKTSQSLGSTPAIYLVNLTDCVIENCTIDIPEGSKAIVESGTSDNNVVRNNVIIGKRTVSKKGANSVFEENVIK